MLAAQKPAVIRGVLAIAIQEISAWYRADLARRGHRRGQTGAVTVVQRFGSALQLNVHFHIIVLEGCYVEAADGQVQFHSSHKPSTADVENLVASIAVKAEDWLASVGHGPYDQPDADPTSAQELLQAASLAGRVGLGRTAGQRTQRVVRAFGREVTLPPRCAVSCGYNLHAGVAIGRYDRRGLEQLARYICRPALAKSRLERRPDGMIVLHMKRTWSDGTSAVVFTPAEFVARLASLVPPPNKNSVLYHGVLAPNASLRPKVVPNQSQENRAPQPLAKPRRHRHRPRRHTWSELLWRVFGVEGWLCPHCFTKMRLRTVVIGFSTNKILTSLSRSARAPPLPAEHSL